MANIEGKGDLGFKSVSISATLTLRQDLSVIHLLSAHTFRNRVKALEHEHVGRPLGIFWEEIFANATACVYCAVAAVESYINEMLADRDKTLPHLDKVL